MKYLICSVIVIGFSLTAFAKDQEESIDMGPPAIEELRADLASMKQGATRAPASVDSQEMAQKEQKSE